jgi:hypothetical protein
VCLVLDKSGSMSVSTRDHFFLDIATGSNQMLGTH